MKLLYCSKCKSIFNLTDTMKHCACGETKGMYIDNLNAVYAGDYAVPLGIANGDFHRALESETRKLYNISVVFDAFVIEPDCPTFKKI